MPNVLIGSYVEAQGKEGFDFHFSNGTEVLTVTIFREDILKPGHAFVRALDSLGIVCSTNTTEEKGL